MNLIFFFWFLEGKIIPVYKDIIYFKIAYYFASPQLFPPVRQKALLSSVEHIFRKLIF